MAVSILIHEKRCKSCGICVEFCPRKVFELTPGEKVKAVHVDKCIACKMCEYRCPDLALEVTKE